MCKKYKTYTKIPHIFEFKRKKKGEKKTGKRERKISLSLVHLSCINNKTRGGKSVLCNKCEEEEGEEMKSLLPQFLPFNH